MANNPYGNMQNTFRNASTNVGQMPPGRRPPDPNGVQALYNSMQQQQRPGAGGGQVTPRPGPPDPYAAFSSAADRPAPPPNKPPAYGNPGGPGGGWFNQPGNPGPFERRQPSQFTNPGGRSDQAREKFAQQPPGNTMPGQPSPGLGGVGNQMQPMPGHGFQNPGFGGMPAVEPPPNSWGPSWGMRQPGMPGGFPGFGGGQQPGGPGYSLNPGFPNPWGWGPNPAEQRPPVNTMPGAPSPGLGNVRMQPAPGGGQEGGVDRLRRLLGHFGG